MSGLHEAVSRLDEAWADTGDSSELLRQQLMAVNAAIGMLQRRLNAVHADVAASIARESRPELGPASLARQQGFRTPATMIAATVGVSRGEATRLVKVGEAVAPRANLSGEPQPAKCPIVRDALAAGALGAPAAAIIVELLDRCRVAAGAERTMAGERMLVETAAGLALDDVRKLVARAEVWLDVSGIESREEERRGRRSLTMFERDGMVHLNAQLDPETAAPVVAAMRGYVSAAFAARKDAAGVEGSGSPAGADGASDDSGLGGHDGRGDVDGDRRTVPMLQADALALFATHVLGCAQRLPLAGATVIVRVSLEDLEAGMGSATVDGLAQPVSIGVARRMAAGGGVIPCVLGGASEVLDWGREKRLFTRAQRLALVERDGGCAMCGLPPEMTKAHHIRWWMRDRGPTDLSNGVLLCETCHHRIHDNGREVRIEHGHEREHEHEHEHGHGHGCGKVWFIPPAFIDPTRTPRLGGRARFDFAA